MGSPLAALLYLPERSPIPAGAVIKSIGVYDNTTNNPHKPNDPPQDVFAGSTTEDEMFLTFFIWMNYQTGDEDIGQDSTLFVTLPELPVTVVEWMIHPVPAVEAITITSFGGVPDAISLRFFHATGRLVLWGSYSNGLGSQELVDISKLSPGLYYAELATRSKRSVQRFVKE